MSHIFGQFSFFRGAHLTLIRLKLLNYIVSPTIHDHVFDEFSRHYLETLVDVSLASGVRQKFQASQSDLFHVGQNFIRLQNVQIHDVLHQGLILTRVSHERHRLHDLLE